MNIDQKNVGLVQSRARQFEIADVVRGLTAHKSSIAGTTLAAAVVFATVAYAIPPTFRASTTLLPPQQTQSGAAALLSQLGGAAGMVAGAAGMKNSSETYLGILKSRTIADALIKRLDLLKVYETASLEEARAALKERTAFTSGKDGLITIAVDDHEAVRAAKLANGYVDELTQLTKVLALTEASQRRLFFEQQLVATKDNLAAAELALKRGLETKGVISVDADSRTALETVARLRARISAKEVELNAMRSFVTENNNDFKRNQAELASLRAELSTLENGRSTSNVANDGKQTGLENIRVLRDVKYQQMLYEMLAKQYEAARLEEARDSTVIQVLDSAIAPEKKSKPRRSVIVLVGAFASFILSLAAFSWLERCKRTGLAGEGDGFWKTLRRLAGIA